MKEKPVHVCAIMKFPGYTTRKMESGRDMYEAHDNAMSFLRRQHQMGKKFKFKIEPTDIVGFKGVRFYMNKNELNN